MLQENINIGRYKHIARLYKHGVDFNTIHTKQYVMLRKYSITNDLANDTDIYFIERDILPELLADLKSSDNTNKIVFPNVYKKLIEYSSNYTLFNNDIYFDNIDIENNDYGIDIYPVVTEYENDKPVFANIECDELRIYHPANFSSTNYIIHISSYCNNMRIHYYCNLANNLISHSDEEFIIDNNPYSEYFKVYVPSFKSLFDDSVYYKENINNILLNVEYYTEIKNNTEISEEYERYILKLKNIFNQCESIGEHVYMFDTYAYDERNESYYKTFVPLTKNIYFYWADTDSLNSVSYIVYNFKTGEFTKRLTKPNPNTEPNYLSIHIKLYLKTEGDNTEILSKQEEGIIRLNTFLMPSTITVKNNVTYKTITKFNNIKTLNYVLSNDTITLNVYPYEKLNTSTSIYELSDLYNMDSTMFTNDFSFKLSSTLEFNDETGILNLVNTFIYPQMFDSIQDAYCKIYNVSVQDYLSYDSTDEFGEDYSYYVDSNIKCCGFHIVVADNWKFDNVIYKYDVETIDTEDDFNFIENFSFALNNLFESWNNMPEMLVAKATYIDKLNNKVIAGNDVLITKEKFKYLINDTNKYRFNMANFKSGTDGGNFNFIDKITCNIIKEDSTVEVNKQHQNARILYKPIFYRVSDAQSIKLRNGIKQNIGINLVDYMTKVETFKIHIGNDIYNETARNDIYVIFNIDSNSLSSTTGVYDILDDESNYITSGTWQLY